MCVPLSLTIIVNISHEEQRNFIIFKFCTQTMHGLFANIPFGILSINMNYIFHVRILDNCVLKLQQRDFKYVTTPDVDYIRVKLIDMHV